MGISFLVVALSLLSVSIYTVYSLLSVLFTASSLGRTLILILLIVISLGFIGVLILSQTVNSQIVNWLYIVFSLALGFLFYLTIFSILFQIVKLFNINQLVFVRIGFLLALILFIIGLYDAAFSKVKELSINMTGLSSEWQGKKIVQISDVHLGSIYGLNFLDRQITKINTLQPDLIVITGDLFDGTEHNLNSFGPTLAKLQAVLGVIFIPGNHDTNLGLDKIKPVLDQANILMLRDEAITINGLEIIGLDIHNLTQPDSNLVVQNLNYYHGQARLLLKHVPKDIAWAKAMNIDLQLSGHSHNGQMFPLSVLTYLFYGKYQYGFYTDGSYNIYTSSGLGSWGPPLRTFNQAEIINITLN